MDHIDIVKAQGGYMKSKLKQSVVLWKIKENLLKIRKLSQDKVDESISPL